ncbi:MAG: hypothetical protein ABSC94_32600 [Polyangiaceae bacterium]|jgi:hypothetical protein
MGAEAADLSSCATGAPLSGATYDISKSRFAFGSTPVEQDGSGFVRWVGTDGVVGIWADGNVLGTMNAGAPETNLPDWSPDTAALTNHVIEYFGTMGLAGCQIASSSVFQMVGGSESADGGVGALTQEGGNTIVLARSISGIAVVESLASARFDSANQTTSESLYWPTVPADVVASARGFSSALADPAQLAAFKAKLPSDAQGDGQVVIHHTSAYTAGAFQAATTYDVGATGNDFASKLSFDPSGNPVPNEW